MVPVENSTQAACSEDWMAWFHHAFVAMLCVLQVARASDFYQRQDQYRQQRRSRLLARQQRLAQLEQAARQQQEQQQQAQQEGEQQGRQSTPGADASTAAAWIAGPADAADAGRAPGLTPENSGSSIASIDGQPLRVVVHSGSSDAAAGGSDPGSAGGSKGSGNLSSITNDEDTCGICFDNNNHVAVKYCGHRLCVDCYRQVWQLSGGDSTCPFCRARLEGYMYIDDPRYMDLE